MCCLMFEVILSCDNLLVAAGPADDKLPEDGFTSLFDGMTLNGWDGDSEVFRVAENPVLVPFAEFQNLRQFILVRSNQNFVAA